MSIRLIEALRRGKVVVRKRCTGEVAINGRAYADVKAKTLIISTNNPVDLLEHFTEEQIKRSNVKQLLQGVLRIEL